MLRGWNACRHGHVTTLLDAGLDINYVSQNVGHSSTETTKLYGQRGVRRSGQ